MNLVHTRPKKQEQNNPDDKAHSPENKLPVDYSDQHKYEKQRNPRYGGAIPNYLYPRQTCLQKREEQTPDEHHNNLYTQTDKTHYHHKKELSQHAATYHSPQLPEQSMWK